MCRESLWSTLALTSLLLCRYLVAGSCRPWLMLPKQSLHNLPQPDHVQVCPSALVVVFIHSGVRRNNPRTFMSAPCCVGCRIPSRYMATYLVCFSTFWLLSIVCCTGCRLFFGASVPSREHYNLWERWGDGRNWWMHLQSSSRLPPGEGELHTVHKRQCNWDPVWLLKLRDHWPAMPTSAYRVSTSIVGIHSTCWRRS